MANVDNARKHINETLELTVGTFQKTLADRRLMLMEKVRLLSGDFAFKQAFATGDERTILSALLNHSLRVGADVMMLLTIEEGDIIANTLRPGESGGKFPFTELFVRAMNSKNGDASGIVFLNKTAFQLVLVPLFTPHPSAWLVIGFTIDESFSSQIQHATNTHVSLLNETNEGVWSVFSSTLEPVLQQALTYHLASTETRNQQSTEVDMMGEVFMSLLITVQNGSEEHIAAVLQRSLDVALIPYLKLRSVFVAVFGACLVLASIGGLFVSRSVTQPVEHLETAARRITEGDYTTPVFVPQKDELGRLAQSFNIMMQGLAERARVTSLLGKVVSPAIADELLAHGVELGGEEREVTILFSDVRNFTSLCENRTPGEILTLLNNYLSRVNAVIDQNNGVVDKFVGDAVMALFGAPIAHENDPEQAVMAGLAMCTSLDEMNRHWAQSGGPQLQIGVGINTAKVLVGNVGSDQRLNYTVIGDGVNLASRLEGITKQYNVEMVVSEATRNQCSNFLFRELDYVKVKGKSRPVSIYQPLGLCKDISDFQRENLDIYHRALGKYRSGDWWAANNDFSQLLKKEKNSTLYRLYLDRIRHFVETPPANDWDGTFTYLEK